MDLLNAIILGIVQGITEWLPISSSGHLVIFQQVLGLQADILFDTALHVATLLAVIIVFRHDLHRMLKALLKWDTENKDFTLIWKLAIGSVPIAVIGFLLKDWIEAAFNSPLLVAISLLVTGGVLWSTQYAKKKGSLTAKNSLLIGIAQAFALLPGISRSGMTLAASLHLGLEREEAARYSFLLFVPAALGAGILQVSTADWSAITLLPIIAGMLVTLIVSVIALRWLLSVIKQGRLHAFSWYCWILGLILLGLYSLS